MTTFGADPNYQKKLAVMLMQQGVDASPVQHWTQGAARMAQALVGGNMMRSEREADDEANRNAMASLLGAASRPLSRSRCNNSSQPHIRSATLSHGRMPFQASRAAANTTRSGR